MPTEMLARRLSGRVRGLLALLVGFGSAAASLGDLGPGAGIVSCRRVSGEALGWVHSGAFTGDTLVLSDVSLGGLQTLHLGSSTWVPVSHPGQGSLEFERVIVVRGDADGVLLNAVDKLVHLDASLRPVRSTKADSILGAESSILSLAATADGRALGFLAGTVANGESLLGLGAIRLQPGAAVRPVRPVDPTRGEMSYYTSLFSFGAEAANRLFWLRMETPAHVLEVTADGSRTLDVVPVEWRTVPPFHSGGPESMVQNFARLERQSFLAGLYGHGKELFLLHRAARSAAGAHWQLEAIDPDRPGRGRRLTLPTGAPWLTLVPGPKVWALLEQGPIESAMPSRQATRSVLLLPSSWFTAPASPLTKERKDLCP